MVLLLPEDYRSCQLAPLILPEATPEANAIVSCSPAAALDLSKAGRRAEGCMA
jgi:hypothetical protein